MCIYVCVVEQTQNVFLTSSGIVKLGDFGIARRMDSSLDFAKTQIGTSCISALPNDLSRKLDGIVLYLDRAVHLR